MKRVYYDKAIDIRPSVPLTHRKGFPAYALTHPRFPTYTFVIARNSRADDDGGWKFSPGWNFSEKESGIQILGGRTTKIKRHRYRSRESTLAAALLWLENPEKTPEYLAAYLQRRTLERAQLILDKHL